MSDSDDDLPISELIKKRKRQEQLNPVKAAATKVKAEPVKKSKPVETKSTTSQSSSRSNGSNKSARFYDETKKGFLIQKFLVRWWYAVQWPEPQDIEAPPAGYEALDGFTGVFISTRTDSLGHILDLRNKETCPNLRNTSKFSCSKIKELCISAYKKQMEVLEEHEGADCKLLRELKSELAEVKGIDTDKADKEAKKFDF